MVRTLSLLGISFFLLFLIAGRSRAYDAVVDVIKSNRSIGLTWFFLFLAKTIFVINFFQVSVFEPDYSSPIVQLVFVALAILSLLSYLINNSVDYGFKDFTFHLLIIYAFFGLISSILSPKIDLAVYKISLVFIDCFLLAATVGWQYAKKTRYPIFDALTIFAVCSLFGSLLGAFVLPSAAFKANPGPLGVMLFGLFPVLHANELGMLASMGFLVFFVHFMMIDDLRSRLMNGSVLVMSAIVLFLAQSRTAIVATAIGIPIIFVFSGRRHLLRFIVFSFLAIFLCSFVVLVSELRNQELLSPLVQYLQRGQNQSGLETLYGRFSLWMGLGLELVQESPWFGAGFDVGVRFSETSHFGHLHNSYFQVLANSGILSFIPWFLFLWTILFRVFRRFWSSLKIKDPTDHKKYMAMKVFVACIPLVARSFTGSVMLNHSWSLMFFLALFVEIKWLEAENKM
ncbi:O-antigen ligase family protein [Desulfomicrobium sp. ZS1]|uniref:O-antigen ligase family protein n=1 Tax=Desulfomicrobium sp. ZS1 TaxID=2952228 RepID=UPI0020B24D7E|nr:O-antigen ligase family protein [Desulfomicrobium sp. ZS1]UTF49426.1 O-antigen ligase family protein [Desulfomicrobium sp. ZS1]